MSRENENQHVEATPHFDGEKEGIINDSTATSGKTMGVQINNNNNNVEFALERNPFHFKPKKDPEMEKFERLMRGNKIE
ncbi:hypothetical protein [Neobacillus sp. FSL H8-0543]|uniref:hypothetical protein n=1 Tax=Neobacillus sp. FSL H8-0543 TaxID=2954672 RepID=UPI003158A2BA